LVVEIRTDSDELYDRSPLQLWRPHELVPQLSASSEPPHLHYFVSLFGVYGANSTANMVERHTREVSDLTLVPIRKSREGYDILGPLSRNFHFLHGLNGDNQRERT